MAKKKLHAMDLDLDEVSPVVQNALKKIGPLERKRAKVNADIKVLRDAVYAAGIDRATFQFIKARHEMDPVDRQLADEAQIVGAKAAGIPISVQSDLFNHIEEAEPVDVEEDEPEVEAKPSRRKANGKAAEEGAEARA